MPPDRRLAAIMFTDIVGYTALMARDEEAGRRARDRHEAVVRPLVERYGGQWIERTGDETLSSFPSALAAVNCALAAQAELDGDSELQLRIGIHQGDVTFDAQGVAGSGVNVAARVRPFAEPGGIAISDDVHGSVQGRRHLEFKSLGPQDLQHVPRTVTIYAVSGDAAEAPPWSKAALILAQPELRSVAVLPLESIGPSENEYVADGVTDALIESLACVGPELRVTSRTSVKRYKNTTKTAREIARELSVQLLVGGTVLREDDDVLVRLQLIDAERDSHVWAQSYERRFSGLLRLGREIARTVAGEIEGVLKPESELLQDRHPPVDPQALDLYLKARALWGPFSMVASWGQPVADLLERAVGIDPVFSTAWAALARVHASLGVAGGSTSQEEFTRARQIAEKALRRDELSGEAHTVVGLVRFFHDWDLSGARSAFERAVEVSPSDPAALLGYSLYLRYVGSGKSPEAEMAVQRLLQVAPFDPYYRTERLYHFWYTRQYERALTEAEQIKQFDTDFVDIVLANVYRVLGRHEEFVRETLAYFTRLGASGVVEAIQRGIEQDGWLGGVEAMTSIAVDRERQDLPGLSLAYSIATQRALVGAHEDAMTWLERAYEKREPMLIQSKTQPEFDPIRSDPRFRDLLRRIGFPEE
jgi:class 3 adenylate cyclase/tetratricopeptide (TPR) repeat protein